MDKLLNDFTVQRPIEETWAVLTDVERIAPCLPGAQLEEIEGDVYRGVVKVKLGAISTAFRGQASFVERDDAAHRAVLHGEGRDTTGKGNADAMITARLEEVDPSTTRCVVETDLRITGKVAQFGRGIMGDVSKKLIAQFAQNLNTMLDEGGSAGATPVTTSTGSSSSAGADDAAGSADAADAADAAGGADAPVDAAATHEVGSTATTTEEPKKPTVRKIDGPANEPIELSNLAGGAIMKRVLPVVGGVVALLLVLRSLRRRA